MPLTQDCPKDLIHKFVSGDISPEALHRLEQHLTCCEGCSDALTQQTADPKIWNDAKNFLGSDRIGELKAMSTRCDNLDQVLALILNPTDDPDMMGRFGGYEVCGVIGRGGMGIVLKGLDVSLDRFVAIKVLDPSYASGSAARQRFIREAQAAAAVVHDNVIAIYGVDHSNQFPYLVMPYVKGESLQNRIDRTAPLPLEDILSIASQIAKGLSAAHDQGLVHRDIKPANILMPESVSRVIITDFGLARAADDASLTRSGVIAGTPQYMSPEQVAGDPVDGRTDLFSLGSVMYAMMCGHPPFRADTSYGVMRRITDQQHRPLTDIRPDTPAWLTRIIDKLLEKDPADRFSSSAEVATLVEDCLAHIRQPTTAMLPKIQRSRRSIRRTRIWIGAAMSMALIGILAMLSISHFTANDRRPIATDSVDGDIFAPPLDNSALLELESDLDQLWIDVTADTF